MRAARRIVPTNKLGRAALAGRLRSTLAADVEFKPLRSILIANRGEIALRVGRTAADYGIRTTTVYTDPDAQSQHALSSPFSVNLGEASAYLDGDRIIQVAREHGCQGIHPGYGFLSENPSFAKKCVEAGITFIGPPWQAIQSMGSKSESKDIMTRAGVQCVPGYHGGNQDPKHLASEAEKIGYPVLVKAVKGGGGKGMRIVQNPEDFLSQLDSAKSEARSSFGDDVMLVEKYITTPRHIEVQVFADKHGNCVALGERDCSVQRRHQKILEESPAPGLDDSIRKDLWGKARQAALAVGYEGAGTVEFIFDNETGQFFFMEMNTRLQVEHPVTEMVTRQDLVHWQFIVAEGGKLPLTQEQIEEHIQQRGHAIEARIYAENPAQNFMPSSGLLVHLKTPPPTTTLRIDAGFVAGDEVSSHYDPMIAKLIVQAPTRTAALQKMRAALEEYEVVGPVTNIEFLKRLCISPAFLAGEVETGYIQKHHEELFTVEHVPNEAWAQAAICLVLKESIRNTASAFGQAGFVSSFQTRQYNLVELSASAEQKPAKEMNVVITQTSPGTFDVVVDSTKYDSVKSTYDVVTSSLTSYFPHTRISTTVVTSASNGNKNSEDITLFQRGNQYRLAVAVPDWFKTALGNKDVANSVLAPMPCKVLRVEIKEGDEVTKDQPLVVVESMKMEMVIRSPGDGRVRRIPHRAGDICKQGTALVEFEDDRGP